jgi:hypothetical protein
MRSRSGFELPNEQSRPKNQTLQKQPVLTRGNGVPTPENTFRLLCKEISDGRKEVPLGNPLPDIPIQSCPLISIAGFTR